jgi:hypothetical protein
MITYSLGNGATWGAALASGNCVYAASATGAVTVAMTDGGGTDDSTAEFRVDVTAAMAATDTFTLTYDVNNADPLATAAAVITLGITLTDGLGNVDTVGSENALTSADGTTEALAASVAAGTLFIDVATGSLNFDGTSVDVLTATSVRIGSLTITDNAGPLEDDAATAWAHAAGDATATGTLTLTGNFAACVTAPGDVTVGGISARTVGTITADTVTIPLTNAQLLAMGSGVAQDVVMIVDGVTAIQETTPTGALDITWTDGTYLPDQAAGTFRALSRNGTIVYPGIVIGSGFGYEGGFRIVNRSANAANIYFQVQNYNGAMLNQVAYSGNPLAAGATVYIPTDTVLTEGGLTTTSSANGIISVESDMVDIYQISYKSGGYTIVPLTKANNQAY